MKVLILSAEVWQDSMNGGNVLSNMFTGSGFELAQIYCNPGEPNNELCTHYYQMTDSMVIRTFVSHKPIGRQFDTTEGKRSQCSSPEKPNTAFYTFFHKHRLALFNTARRIAWNLSNWKNAALKSFVEEFNPDIIFAPCYGDTFLLRLTRFVAELTGKNIISYISDDSYTLRQFSFSPFFWINRFQVRRELKKTFPYYSLVYAMTQAQKEQCEKDFNANMKILLKSVDVSRAPKQYNGHSPIRIIYAGGIYLNRYKTLSALSEAIGRINVAYDRDCFCLDIFTGNEITRKIRRMLDRKGTTIHGLLSRDDLEREYQSSDIALHVESFDLKNRLKVRMSFSTKITDCLGSGCAVMAICDEKQGGYQYLKQNDAAICISDYSHLYAALENIVQSPGLLSTYMDKARECCIKNHNSVKTRRMIQEDFRRYESTSN